MSYETITPRQAYARMQEQGAHYIDVRTDEEFAAGHAQGAVHIPMHTMTAVGREMRPEFLPELMQQFPKDAPLIIACAAGGRSRQVCEMLVEQGYTNCANMDGGFTGRRNPLTQQVAQAGWKDEGLPVS